MGACGLFVPSPNHMPSTLAVSTSLNHSGKVTWDQSVECFKECCYLNQCFMMLHGKLDECGRTITPSETASDGSNFSMSCGFVSCSSDFVPAQCCMLACALIWVFWLHCYSGPIPALCLFVCFLVFWGLRLIMHSNMVSFIIVLALCKCHALSFAFLFVILFCLVSSPRDWPCAQMSFNLV